MINSQVATAQGCAVIFNDDESLEILDNKIHFNVQALINPGWIYQSNLFLLNDKEVLMVIRIKQIPAWLKINHARHFLIDSKKALI